MSPRLMSVNRSVAAIALLVLLTSCSATRDRHAVPEDIGSSLPVATRIEVPDVTGESAPVAVGNLRDAGFATLTVVGRWSDDPIGTVLSQDPAPRTAGNVDGAARLTVSLGAERALKRGVFVGLGTCDLGVQPTPPVPCAGGPILLWP